jgi:hypothetical protein
MRIGLAGGVIAVLVIIAIIVGYGTLFTVSQTQQALVVRLGKPVRVITDPGLNVKVPFIDSVIYVDKRILNIESPAQEITLSSQDNSSTSGVGEKLVVDAFARYRITDPLKYYQTVGVSGADAQLSVLLNSALRSVLGPATLTDVVRDRRDELMVKMRNQIRAPNRSAARATANATASSPTPITAIRISLPSTARCKPTIRACSAAIRGWCSSRTPISSATSPIRRDSPRRAPRPILRPRRRPRRQRRALNNSYSLRCSISWPRSACSLRSKGFCLRPSRSAPNARWPQPSTCRTAACGSWASFRQSWASPSSGWYDIDPPASGRVTSSEVASARGTVPRQFAWGRERRFLKGVLRQNVPSRSIQSEAIAG